MKCKPVATDTEIQQNTGLSKIVSWLQNVLSSFDSHKCVSLVTCFITVCLHLIKHKLFRLCQHDITIGVTLFPSKLTGKRAYYFFFFLVQLGCQVEILCHTPQGSEFVVAMVANTTMFSHLLPRCSCGSTHLLLP